MKLKECYIKEFGGIKNKRISFKDGLCSFIGKNGAGKTTLATFIKAMLYGIGDTKKTRLDENDRRHYLPRSGGIAGGTLTFSLNGREYRIERTFGKRAADDSCTVYDSKTGKLAERFTKKPGEDIFFIDVSGFERTLYLSERNLSAASDPDSISARLSSLVSTDMDIDSLERAKKVLEEQRKFYTKKGGGGEIAATRDELNSTNRDIEALKSAEERMACAMLELSKISKLEDDLRHRGEEISRRREAIKEGGIREALSARLAGLRSELSSLVSTKSSLMEFFGGDIPKFEDIEKHRQMSAEAQRLLDGSSREHIDAEYRGLDSYFDGRCTPTEIEKIRINAAELERKTSALDDFKSKTGSLFGIRIPSSSEILEIRDKYRSSKKGKGILRRLTLVLGLLLVLCGGAAGFFANSALYGLCAVGAICLLIVGASSIAAKGRKAKRRRVLLDFLESVCLYAGSDEKQQLLTLDRMLSASLKIEESDAEIQLLRDELNAFLSKFFTRGWVNPMKSAMEIVEKYEYYLSLRAVLSSRTDTPKSARERGEALSSEVELFLRKFKLKTDKPFDELYGALREYERTTSRIVAIRAEIESITSMNGIYAGYSGDANDSEEQIKRDKEKLDEDIRAMNGKRAAIEAQYRSDEEAVKELDKLLSEKEKLSTRVEKYEKNARIIALTAEHLGYAAENMTERYLGRSRQSLENYASLLSFDTDRRINIDTELQVSVTEDGKTHPTDGYSRGERELYGLCVRLGLVDALFTEEEPFIILDDPFISFDDSKIDAARSLLTRLGAYRQILYFTCSESRSFPDAMRL